jgi:putative hydrolase of the HAD superfamily
MTPVFIFDIGNVLIDFDLARLQQRIAEASGTLLSCVQGNWRDRNLEAVETGRLSGPEYFQGFCDRVGLRWNYEEWIAAWMDIYSRNPLGQGLFDRMKRRNYPVCILSNLAQYNKIAIERKFEGFFPQASRSFLSYEMGLLKPSPQIYDTVRQSLGAAPEECIVLDDSADNVDGARRAGLCGYLFSPQGFETIVAEIEETLKKYPVPSQPGKPAATDSASGQ